MFTNAGMVQFKNVFTGQEQYPYKIVTTVQKCVRAGGKHNDLYNVGRTARHHTFFEMLGNFSFSDYFKEQAIDFAWQLLTREFGLSRHQLLVTVYYNDDDAFNFWKKISGLPNDRIIRISSNDNFWSMADTGPCGPCSEIFFDRGDKFSGGLPGSSEEDGERYIEIWNLVFMQFEQLSNKERIALPRPSIDTGMGLERFAAVLQGKENNYDIDLFRALISASEQFTGVPSVGRHAVSHRIIVDHLRSSVFLIADGVLPGNEGRGYVLRRIMRRAMCHAQILGVSEPFMWRLLPALFAEMGTAYPELIRAESLIIDVLKQEEVRFRKTLERGLVLLDEVSVGLEKHERLDGNIAFKLYDTYGFPLDLMQDILHARGFAGIEVSQFNQAMERQKTEARLHWLGSGEKAIEKIWFSLKEKHGVTRFLGYDTDQAEAMVQAIIDKGKVVDSAKEGEMVFIIVDQTPFYAESGGQVGDTGTITGEGVQLKVIDTKKQGNDLWVHSVVVEHGTLRTGMSVTLKINAQNRRLLSINHSVTHLLHWALHEVLGFHVVQKGSRITHEGLRFDVTHSQPITLEEIKSVEDMMNEVILQNLPVTTSIMNIDSAIAIGATALFGEKYGNEVRVVSIGLNKSNSYSLELCGGTHVSFTGEIGLVHILSESAVGAGIRRIEAITGKVARAYLLNQDEQMKSLSALLKVQSSEVLIRVKEMREEKRKLEYQLADAKKKLVAGDSHSSVREVAGINFIGHVVTDINPKNLRELIDERKKRIGSGIIMLIALSEEDKASVIIAVTQDLISKFNAIYLVQLAARVMEGKGGGGRPDMAQSGGPNGKNAKKAIEEVIKFLEEQNKK
ncbi:Alanyl-tRNA synthetase [Liberibacter crescens BT-1]|uniref:Alanine--tRNA ligase n=2 Tax=Liberibacter crescens TaxID=1273132 RepID=L0ESG0_LIBCB|nr:Alanyl-tRNA synthetase [Liberibacter crescens BT-1]